MRTLIAAVALTSLAFAADFQKVKLLDVQPYVEAQAPFIATNPSCPSGCPVSVTRNKQAFVLTVGLEGMSYSATYYETKRFHSADFVVGDEIEARISGGELTVKDSEGRLQTSRITRRARWEHN